MQPYDFGVKVLGLGVQTSYDFADCRAKTYSSSLNIFSGSDFGA